MPLVRNSFLILAAFGLPLLAVVVASADPPKPDSTSAPAEQSAPGPRTKRKIWTTSRVLGRPEKPAPLREEVAYPKIRFKNPVVLIGTPGSNRWFVGEQTGKIYSFQKDPNATQSDLFLDVAQLLPPAKTASTAVDNSQIKGLEALYGLTFHPQFASNRFVYVCYVVRGGEGQLPDGTRVSRFKVTDTDPPKAIPESEEIVITWLQGGHNGGCLDFGPDGNLYISTGDGGFANPPDGRNAGQDVSNLLSSVLRIDVDHPDAERLLAYSIPKDNPFVGLPGARGEIWCYGLRNPWKMKFDRQSGDLWVGDVGWELWELVFKVQKGGNYGWSVVEGRQPVHPERKIGPTPILPPTIEVPHTDGVSITGGYVYRGKKYPELVGSYIWGDWETRRIWSSKWDEASQSMTPMQDVVESTVRLVDFAEDDDGELFLLDYDHGTIHELVRNPAAAANEKFPVRLSETGLYESVPEQTLASGVLPFEIRAEQWADHASARRYIGLPSDEAIQMHSSQQQIAGSMFQSSMKFPKQTVLAKTFSMEMKAGDPRSRRAVETQLLHYDGRFWRGYTYAWNDEQTDAELVEPHGREITLNVEDAAAPGGRREQTWHFSSRVECARCHNQWAEYALAFQIRQLNRDIVLDGQPTSQLERFQRMGLIEIPVTKEAKTVAEPAIQAASDLPHFVDPYQESEDLTRRARSWLHVNCAHCHRTGGGGSAYIELREELPIEGLKAIEVRPTQGTFDIPDARIIAAGNPFRSSLFYRISKSGSGRMPHIGSEIVDDRGVELVYNWIHQMPTPFEAGILIARLGELDESRAQAREQQVDNLDANQRRARQEKRNREREATVAKLLESPQHAIVLSRAVQSGQLPVSVRQQVIDAAAARPEPQWRDLFERFLPADRRVKRLGALIRPDQLLAMKGDAARGQQLFANTVGIACKNCHRIGETGSKLGPELTLIARKYSRAQILDSILEPSKVIDPKYVSYVVQTQDGRVHSGLLTDNNPKEVVLRNAKDEVVRIPTETVEEISPQRQSLMPDLLLKEMTAEQVADLLEYLATLR